LTPKRPKGIENFREVGACGAPGRVRATAVSTNSVLGDNGRQAEICQKILEIDAPTEGEATEIAKQRICKAERLCEWSLHADRIQVKSADFSL
jgi:hypothetical protein